MQNSNKVTSPNIDYLRQFIDSKPVNVGKSRYVNFTEFKDRTIEILDGLRMLGIASKAMKFMQLGINLFVIMPES